MTNTNPLLTVWNETMNQIHTIAFYICITCIVVATILAIAGLWMPETSYGRKLMVTDLIICLGCGLIAAITKWLT